MDRPLRVAVTLEQCWHRVPGGTATSVLRDRRRPAAERDDVDLVGVAARHGQPAAGAVDRPPIPVWELPLPRLALYEAWHRCAGPRSSGRPARSTSI